MPEDLHLGEVNSLDASGDKDFIPDHQIVHGEVIEGSDWQLDSILTPGHAMNHVCFALKGTDYLFSRRPRHGVVNFNCCTSGWLYE